MELDNEQAVETSESAVDRISSLPTDILHNILSLVRIRTVVRMRRLSKWWRHLCESLQFICLRSQEFENWNVRKFTRFVSNLLLLRAKVDLHKFQLDWCCDRSLNCNDVMMWIGYAVNHNVKVLNVELDGYDRNFLPHCVFTCTSLQELNLQLEGTSSQPHMLPDTINLPSLRKLTLVYVEMSQLSLDQIISQSPGLEDLDLRNCSRYFNLIDSKVLKRLRLDWFYDVFDSFTISAPQLIHFTCKGCSLEDISWIGQPSLESARIEGFGDTVDGQSGFTGIISHAKRLELTLYGFNIKVILENELPTSSVFENLEFLQIGEWCITDSLYIILRFLQLSPRLQKLILAHKEFYEAGKGAETHAMLSNEMAFQCPHLQTVIIRCSKDDNGINTMVNAMVANGVSLEKIQISYYEDMRQEWRKEFGNFEKTLKENPECVDSNSYAGNDSDDDDGDEWEDEDEDDDLDDEDVDDESGDSDDYDESGDSDDDDDEIEDEEDDDKMEDEDGSDDDMEDEDVGDHDMENGVDN